MMPARSKYLATLKSQSDWNLFVPLFFILMLIAFVSASQTYYLLHLKIPSSLIFFRIALSKMIYYWYFIMLAFVIRYLSKRVVLTSRTVFRWTSIHLITLILSFFVHETLSLASDTLVWGRELKANFFYLFFNNPSVWIELLVYVLFLLSFYLIEYRRLNQENETKCLQMEMQLIKSKLQELRSKIQPTFLFNTLHTILELIRTHRNKDANYILSLLSDFLRTIVYDNERDESTLEEEVRFLNQYLEIQKLRNQHMVHVYEEIEQNVSHAVVPSFILQPIVEELVCRVPAQHQAKLEIKIRANKNGDDLEVMIEGGKMRMPGQYEEPGRHGDVLHIIKERLSQLFGENQELTVRSIPDVGVVVRMRIPFREVIAESGGAFVTENVL